MKIIFGCRPDFSAPTFQKTEITNMFLSFLVLWIYICYDDTLKDSINPLIISSSQPTKWTTECALAGLYFPFSAGYNISSEAALHIWL